MTFGGGTSVVGGLRTGGIDRPTLMVSMARFDEILDIDEESRLVRVGAGMTGPRLERLLSPSGTDDRPLSAVLGTCHVRGYAATRSAGQSSTGYGRSDQMIEGVHVVTPRGEVEAGHFAATAAGPDLRGVFIGSEGRSASLRRLWCGCEPRLPCAGIPASSSRLRRWSRRAA